MAVRRAHAWFAIAPAAAMLAMLAITGCGSHRGGASSAATSLQRAQTHTVRSGETLYHIAEYYGVSPAALMEANDIHDPRDLRVGQIILIPGRYRSTAIGSADESGSGPERPPPPQHAFAWPISGGTLSSPFGIRHGVMHDGIDIAAPIGTPVMAADSGIVVYSGKLRGYGNVVIIQHTDHFATVYGHDSVNRVSTGDRVTRGEIIGKVGDSGRTTGPNLHFEVRHDNLAYNPLIFLPVYHPQIAQTFAGGGGS